MLREGPAHRSGSNKYVAHPSSVPSQRVCLCTRDPGPDPLGVALCWYDPVMGEFLQTHPEVVESKRQAEEGKRLADAKVAELEALVEKMRRG